MVKVEILPKVENSIFEQRETGITHSAFAMENVLYNAIKDGNKELVNESIKEYLANGLVIGRMSENSLKQTQYWAIACISVAIHYAILGGMDETDAFNLSDEYIRHVDHLHKIEDCILYLKDKAVELTDYVKEAQTNQVLSPLIRKVLHYIHIHLHDRLTIKEIARQMGLSQDYLSVIFRQQMNMTLHQYILHEKLEASKIMLLKGEKYDLISYSFSFCSETHYINCFKREYGMTPGAFRRNSSYGIPPV